MELELCYMRCFILMMGKVAVREVINMGKSRNRGLKLQLRN